MTNAQRITSLRQLKRKASKPGGEDFFILLGNGLLRSSKWIRWDNDERKFLVMNEIDGSQQELTEEQIMNKKHTLIGEAIKNGALFMYG
jgi:hypothetical protein